MEKLKVQDTSISFSLNGKNVTVTNPDPKMSLNEYIRTEAGLTGTKKTCGEGGCGACTVTLSRFDKTFNKQVYESVNSCLRPICSVDGMAVTTVEGVGGQKQGFHPIQERVAECNGTQCGFCTPGMVMGMYSLLQQNPNPTMQQIEDNFDGNICRCTGYRPILTAMHTFASDAPQKSESCCKVGDIEELCSPSFQKYEHKVRQEKIRGPSPKDPIQANGYTWYTPTTLAQVYQIMQSNSGSAMKLVVGNTSTGIFKDEDPTVLIDISNLDELTKTSLSSSGASFGAAITISDLMTLLTQYGNSTQFPSYQTARFLTLVNHIKRVANVPVRNAASWAGNLMLSHLHDGFPSDLYTILLGAGATLTIGSSSGVTPNVNLTDFVSVDMTNKVVVSMNIPLGPKNECFKTYKVSLRHENSHAIINAALSAVLDANNTVVGQPVLAYGGVLGHAVRMKNTEVYLQGKVVTDPATLKNALQVLQTEGQPDPKYGKTAYRKSLITSLFYKFFLCLQPSVPSYLKSVVSPFVRPISGGSQQFQNAPSEYPVGEAIPKLAGKIQASGEATFTGDVPSPQGTLYAALVLSQQANATIASIDPSAALGLPGVKTFFSAKDLQPANNIPQPFLPDEEIFASTSASYYGQCLGVIVADTQRHADEAAKKVKVTYSNVQSPILSIEDAIAQNSFYPNSVNPTPVSQGNNQQGFAQSANIVSGEVSIGSQAHFHMETQTVLCVPEEMGTMKIIGATQWAQAIQSSVAYTLNKPASKVIVEVRRLGGGYGGKITRPIIPFCAVAFASDTLGVPVRMSMSLTANMEMIGKRHPFLCRYKVGFSNSGQVNALEMHLFVNKGAFLDGGPPTETAFQTIDNCYNFPNFYVDSQTCKTNLPPNTSTRGPGWTQGIFIIEHIMEHVASYLQVSPDVVRTANYYTQGQVSPTGQKIAYWTIPDMLNQVKQNANYDNRVTAIRLFNKSNRWNKRGISLLPIRFGVGWQGAQHGALVNIFTDGTVTVSTSGIEMGQGLNTKVLQAAAMSLSIPMDLITIQVASTSTVPNGIPTGGSIGSELCVRATLKACETLNERLAPIRRTMGGSPTWVQLVNAAYNAGVLLQATGHTNPPNSPNGPNQYNSFGVVAIETEVDVLTGELQIVRSDIVFDCGISLNPAIDIGQVEGAFVQGLGLHLTEDVVYAETGELITNGTWEYKPPSHKDIPIEMNVTLLKNSFNKFGVLSSKAVGEPPLTMGCAGLFAAQHAIASARNDIGHTEYFELSSPATVDKIQEACLVDVTQFTLK